MLMQIYLYSQFNHLDFLLYLNSVYYGCGESLKACPVTYRPLLISVIDTESNESHCGVLCNTHLVFNQTPSDDVLPKFIEEIESYNRNAKKKGTIRVYERGMYLAFSQRHSITIIVSDRKTGV